MVSIGPLAQGRPRRRVVIQTPNGWGIKGDDFTTTDRALADQVAAELDRLDPLPCPEHDWVEITDFSMGEPRFLCRWCSKQAWESELQDES